MSKYAHRRGRPSPDPKGGSPNIPDRAPPEDPDDAEWMRRAIDRGLSGAILPVPMSGASLPPLTMPYDEFKFCIERELLTPPPRGRIIIVD